MSILEKIVSDKRADVAMLKNEVPVELMRQLAESMPRPQSLSRALRGEGLKLIAEIKRASPSKGILAENIDPVKLARLYAGNGAAAISVITEKNYFMGDISYISSIKTDLGSSCPPLIRKDFILEPYQIYESRARGADALLLIAAALSWEQLKELLVLGHELELECLVEVHNESELATALDCGAGIIGINNRNLDTFEVNLKTTHRLRPLVPDTCVVVSESGFASRQDVNFIKGLNVNAILVGEAFVKTLDVPSKIRELMS